MTETPHRAHTRLRRAAKNLLALFLLPRYMRLLELFCGTKSVSKAVGDRFTEVINLDIEASSNPTICTNILTWNYKIYPSGYFHTIWASPPCTEFSKLNNSHPEKIPNLPLADSIVKKTIEIIEYFNPERYFIENPQTGILKDREYMLGIPFVDMDYCRFSNWGYRKRTRFWTNATLEDILCGGKGICPSMIGKSHMCSVGNGTHFFYTEEGKTALQQKYSIPPLLIQRLFNAPF